MALAALLAKRIGLGRAAARFRISPRTLDQIRRGVRKPTPRIARDIIKLKNTWSRNRLKNAGMNLKQAKRFYTKSIASVDKMIERADVITRVIAQRQEVADYIIKRAFRNSKMKFETYERNILAGIS